MFVHYKRQNILQELRRGSQCVSVSMYMRVYMCVCVWIVAFTASSHRVMLTCLARIISRFSFLSFFLFSVLSDVRSQPVRLDDPVLVLVHVPFPVPVPARMVFGLILVLDLALARALCSDRHNTYTSHVSQLSYFNAAWHISLYLRVHFNYKTLILHYSRRNDECI